ncbi:MAG: M48 family metallopeptidase [Enterobacteriaceae bacterium]
MMIKGLYQPPQRAVQTEAVLQPGDISPLLTLYVDGVLQQQVSLDQVSISEALGRIPRVITFADGSRFVPEDDKQFNDWLRAHQPPSLIHRLERNKRAIVITLCTTIVALFCYLNFLLPAASGWLATTIPAAIQVSIGDQTLVTMDKAKLLQPSKLPAARQQALHQQFTQAIPEELSHRVPPLKLVFRSHAQGANAFMLADGSLVLTDELVQLAKNDQQLVAVMLHEMGHHYHRHVLQSLIRSSLITVSSAWIIGDVSGVADTLINSSALALSMHYSRDMEREADQFAIEAMQAQSRSLNEMLTIYSALQQQSGTEEEKTASPRWISTLFGWMNTHPDMQERLHYIRQASQNQGH